MTFEKKGLSATSLGFLKKHVICNLITGGGNPFLYIFIGEYLYPRHNFLCFCKVLYIALIYIEKCSKISGCYWCDILFLILVLKNECPIYSAMSSEYIYIRSNVLHSYWSV